MVRCDSAGYNEISAERLTSGVAFAAMHAPEEGVGWERLFWLVFQRSSNPIVLLDDQRQIVEVNDAALALFGGQREQLLGMSIGDSIRPAERELAAREWEQFLSTGQYSGTRALVRADGSEVQIDFAASLPSWAGAGWPSTSQLETIPHARRGRRPSSAASFR